MDSIQISIIIPVYNAEKYIRECLTSIINFNTDKIEVILVNDGSTDASSKICHDFVLKDSRIKLIEQVNKGAATARNTGLLYAQGKYIWFIDADDSIYSVTSLPFLLSFLDENSPDFIEFNYVRRTSRGEKKEENLLIGQKITGVSYLEKSDGRLFLWNHIYKRKIIQVNKLQFLDSISNIEDFLFNIEFLLLAEVCYLFPKAYFYLYNDENFQSTSRNLEKNHLLKLSEDTQKVHIYLSELIQRLSEDKKHVLRLLLNKSIAGFFYSLLRFQYDYQYIKSIISLYEKRNLLPLCYAKDFKMNLFVWVVNHRSLYLLLLYLVRLFYVR